MITTKSAVGSCSVERITMPKINSKKDAAPVKLMINRLQVSIERATTRMSVRS